MKKLDIKRPLSEHNMSQIDLCQKIGVAQQNMSAIVRSGNPTVAKLMQIAEKHEGETLNATLRGDLLEGFIERDVNFVQQEAGREPAYPVHSDGLVSENQQQMIQTSTFCPHCGKKVRVGVILLPEE